MTNCAYGVRPVLVGDLYVELGNSCAIRPPELDIVRTGWRWCSAGDSCRSIALPDRHVFSFTSAFAGIMSGNSVGDTTRNVTRSAMVLVDATATDTFTVADTSRHVNRNTCAADREHAPRQTAAPGPRHSGRRADRGRSTRISAMPSG